MKHHMMLPLLVFVGLANKVHLFNSTDQSVTQESPLSTMTQHADVSTTTRKPCKELCAKPCVHLILTNSSLEVFPDCLPRELETLDLSFNNLTVIRDQDISHLPQLRVLILKHNQISDIRWGSNVLSQLEYLDLSNNHLSVVPKCIMLKKVNWLSLAQNPVSEIEPYAFTCFPNLAFLNLSFTLLGKNTSEDISQSAFALNVTQAQESSLKSLRTLDLSGTYLTRVNQEWSKDLLHLKELHIRSMRNMESLDGLGILFPQLELLNCADSSALLTVTTGTFGKASNLKYVYFQNCNLTSLPPWNISSDYLNIDIRGNPLNCDCELSWLFADHVNITLMRENETFCSNVQGDKPLLSLYQAKQCRSNKENKTHNETTTETTTNTGISSNVTSLLSIFTLLQETSNVSLEPTSPPQEKADHLSNPKTITVFKTTITDSKSTTTMPKIQLFASATPKAVTSPSKTDQGVTSGNGMLEFTTQKQNALLSQVTPFPKSLIGSVTRKADQTSKPTTQINTEKITTRQPDIPLELVNDYDEDDIQTTTVQSKMIACDYDPCRHLQTPCLELQEVGPCLCPGLSSDIIVPDPPRLRDVSQITDTSAQIHWCAPNSVVEKYQLVYYSVGSNNQTVVDSIYDTARQYTIYDLLPDTTYHICAVSNNKAGASDAENSNRSREPCTRFKTKPSYIIILAALSALSALCLLAVTILAACLYKMCRNNQVNQYDTHLVSYKNPAFDYQLTIPSYN
ncbi:leucine-rich repeat neuronal protein 4 [Pelodytes ibericus]